MLAIEGSCRASAATSRCTMLLSPPSSVSRDSGAGARLGGAGTPARADAGGLAGTPDRAGAAGLAGTLDRAGAAGGAATPDRADAAGAAAAPDRVGAAAAGAAATPARPAAAGAAAAPDRAGAVTAGGAATAARPAAAAAGGAAVRRTGGTAPATGGRAAADAEGGDTGSATPRLRRRSIASATIASLLGSDCMIASIVTPARAAMRIMVTPAGPRSSRTCSVAWISTSLSAGFTTSGGLGRIKRSNCAPRSPVMASRIEPRSKSL